MEPTGVIDNIAVLLFFINLSFQVCCHDRGGGRDCSRGCGYRGGPIISDLLAFKQKSICTVCSEWFSLYFMFNMYTLMLNMYTFYWILQRMDVDMLCADYQFIYTYTFIYNTLIMYTPVPYLIAQASEASIVNVIGWTISITAWLRFQTKHNKKEASEGACCFVTPQLN